MLPEPILSAKETEALLHKAMPQAKGIIVERVSKGFTRIRIPFSEWMLRPGNTLSGPAIMTAADTAMYMLILSHYGPKLLAVTSTMNINFLSKPPKGDLIADAKFKKNGQKLIFCDVDVYSSQMEQVAAHVTGSYALPQKTT